MQPIVQTAPRGPAARWKGLSAQRPVFLDYNRVDAMLAGLMGRAAAWNPGAVVGIARGGLVPATIAATHLALPLAALAHDRATGRLHWMGSPPDASRVLLVDDGCSTGRTLERAREALLGEGRSCLTLAVVHDPDGCMFPPDLSHPMRALWRFPWERGETTPDGLARRAAGAGPDHRTERPFTGIALEALGRAGWPGEVVPERSVLLSNRPEGERARIARRLAARGFGDVPLILRPEGGAGAPAALAGYKAAALQQAHCTHAIEADAEQAMRIAAACPWLVVTWWSARRRAGFVVNAARRAAAPACAALDHTPAHPP